MSESSHELHAEMQAQELLWTIKAFDTSSTIDQRVNLL